jgi:chorismate mutase
MTDLTELRKKIDTIDERLLVLLDERAHICRHIGEAKKAQGLPISDPKRENEVIAHIRHHAARLGLDANDIEAIYREIVNMCSSVQK